VEVGQREETERAWEKEEKQNRRSRREIKYYLSVRIRIFESRGTKEEKNM